MQSSAPGEEQPHVSIHTGDQTDGKQLCRKVRGCPSEHEVEREPQCTLQRRPMWMALGKTLPEG